MAEQYGEPTRYLTFKIDNKFLAYLRGPAVRVLKEILLESGGLTFKELRERASIGPRHLKAVLKILFDRDYIITNHQITRLKEKHGIDVQKLRR